MPGSRTTFPAAVAASNRPSPRTERTPGSITTSTSFHEAAGADPAKRLALLEKNHDVVSGNDNALAREVGLLPSQPGRPAKALEILKTHHFHVWEGGGEIHGLWVEANLFGGR